MWSSSMTLLPSAVTCPESISLSDRPGARAQSLRGNHDLQERVESTHCDREACRHGVGAHGKTLEHEARAPSCPWPPARLAVTPVRPVLRRIQVQPRLARQALEDPGDSNGLRECEILGHIHADQLSTKAMDESTSTPMRVRRNLGADPDTIVSFIETGNPEPQPRVLVDRLLYARELLQANRVLAPRFVLGECAAAHHIVLDGIATSLEATDRLTGYGFRVAPSNAPPGIRFFVSSSHAEAEIRALLVAITIVVRELSAVRFASDRRITKVVTISCR
jgi:hypothetical protein